MHEVRASSETAVSFHTDEKRTSLLTGAPAFSTRTFNTAAALGVRRTSSALDHKRPVWRSKRKTPNVTVCSTCLVRSANAAEIPEKSRSYLRTSHWIHPILSQKRRRRASGRGQPGDSLGKGGGAGTDDHSVQKRRNRAEVSNAHPQLR